MTSVNNLNIFTFIKDIYQSLKHIDKTSTLSNDTLNKRITKLEENQQILIDKCTTIELLLNKSGENIMTFTRSRQNLKIRDKLRSAVNNTSDESRFIVTQEMPRQAGCIEENTKTQLHGKSTNVNYQNKLTTITTIKDWEQSYGK